MQPIGGPMSQVVQLPTHPGEPSFPIFSSMLGDVNQVLNPYSNLRELGAERAQRGGRGARARPRPIRAIAEGLERYSSCVFDERQFIWATAEELGDEALDLDTVPRCSPAELAHPRCPLLALNKRAPIRWVRGVSLLDARPVWIPGSWPTSSRRAMLSAGERFHLPISTGCATHVTVEQALLAGIGEVIERDSISLVWLQQLELRIELDEVPRRSAATSSATPAARTGSRRFFDATTEVGVPTVYSLGVSPQNETLAALVMCSTELDAATAIAKIIREAASSRIAMLQPRPVPESWDDFTDVMHGAAFMGRPAQLPAFDFLRHSTGRRRLSDMPGLATGDARRIGRPLAEAARPRDGGVRR